MKVLSPLSLALSPTWIESEQARFTPHFPLWERGLGGEG